MGRHGRLVSGAAVAVAGSVSLLLAQGTAGAANEDVIVVAAGDVACRPQSSAKPDENKCMQEATSDLVMEQNPQAVLALGDLQNLDSSQEEFAGAYDPTWGRFRDKTYPVPGNHDYGTPDAAGYFDYFGERAGDPDKGYYSFNLGNWHLVALNSTLCEAEYGGCESGSEQEQWLRADLEAHPNQCTLAFWHAARYSSGQYRGSNNDTEPLWQALYDAHAELVLSGHAQHYERFAPQDAEGNADEQGMRQFVVGTGGQALHPLKDQTAANSESSDNTTLGVLKLALHSNSYDWEFVPVPGSGGYTDSGEATCTS